MRIRIADGVYDGDMVDGRFHGLGILIYDNGSCYEGEFSNGVFHGYGIFKWSDGTCYKGNYQNGKLQGLGVMHYNNGIEYEGEFADNKMDGYGIFKYRDGNIALCEFQQGYMLKSENYNYSKQLLTILEFEHGTKNVLNQKTIKMDEPTFDNALINQITIAVTNSKGRFGKSYINPYNRTQQIAYKMMDLIYKGTEQIMPKLRPAKINVSKTSTGVVSKPNYSRDYSYTISREEYDRIQQEKSAIKCYNSGVNYYNQQDFYKAIAFFEKAKSIFDNYQDKKDCDEFVVRCKHGLERQKYSKILQEAEDYCQSGNLQRAVGILEYGRDTAKDSDTRSMFIEKIESIYNEINNQQADRYYNKAEDCYRSGYYSDAIDYYEKAIDVTNDSRMIEYCRQSISYCKNALNQKNEEEAYKEYEEGMWYYRNENWYSAKSCFERALELANSGDYSFCDSCKDMIIECENMLYRY